MKLVSSWITIGLTAALTIASFLSAAEAAPSPTPSDLSQQVDAKIDKIHSDQKAAAKATLEQKRARAFQEADTAVQAAATAQTGITDAADAEKSIDAALTQLGAAKGDSLVFTDFLVADIQAQVDRKIALNSMQAASQAQAKAQEAMAQSKKAEIQWLEIKIQQADQMLEAGAPQEVVKQASARQKDLAAKETANKKAFEKAFAEATAKAALATKSLQQSMVLIQKADAAEGKVKTFAIQLGGVSDQTKNQKAASVPKTDDKTH